MLAFGGDFRAAARVAARRPAASLALLLTLGVGIGVATPVLSLVDALLLRPLPYPEADRIVGVWFASPNFPGGLPRVRHSLGTSRLFRDRSAVYQAFGLAEVTSVTLEVDGEASRVEGGAMTSEIFAVLGIGVSAGRALIPADNDPGAPPVVVVTEAFSRSRFGGARSAVGRRLTIDGVERTVVGVLPGSVAFPTATTELWVPLTVDPAKLTGPNFLYTGYGRLKPGVDLNAARADFDRVVRLLPEIDPSNFPQALLDRLQLSASFSPLQTELVGDSRAALLVALAAVSLILLIVIGNVATLFLVRAEGRRQEFTIRAALGAPRRELGRGVVVEVSMYAIGGGALGLGIGAGVLRLIKGVGATAIPRIGLAAIDARTIIAVLSVAAIAGLLIGLIVVARLSRSFAGGLRVARTIGEQRNATRFRSALVSGQIGLGLALLTNAGLLVRTVIALQAVPPGFAPDVLGARLFLSPRDYPTFADVSRFYRGVIDDVRGEPGVEAAGAVSFLPLRDGRVFHPWQVEGSQQTTDLPVPILTKVATDGYLEAIGIELMAGRTFTRADIDQSAEVVIVSTEVAAQFWPGQDPIGRRIRLAGTNPGDTTGGHWRQVIGVVGSVRDRDLSAPPPPIVYGPYQESLATGDRRWRELSLAIRAKDDPTSRAAALRRTVEQRDRRVPIADVRTMSTVLGDHTSRARYTMGLVLLTAAAALFLSAVGIYGVLASLVADRRREIGLRVALGATRASVRGMILRRAGLLLAAGAVLGTGLTALLGRLTAVVLYGVSGADPATIAGVAAVVGVATGLAAAIPAARAARVAPMVALAGD